VRAGSLHPSGLARAPFTEAFWRARIGFRMNGDNLCPFLDAFGAGCSFFPTTTKSFYFKHITSSARTFCGKDDSALWPRLFRVAMACGTELISGAGPATMDF
jgi:hypothetical protein